MKPCRCGCGTDLDSLQIRKDAVYATEACSKRFRRAKAAKAAECAASPDKARTRRRRPSYKRLYTGADPYDRPMQVVH